MHQHGEPGHGEERGGPAPSHLAPGDATSGNPTSGNPTSGDPAPGGSERSGPLGQAYWDERYQSRTHVWSGRPNRHLVEEASGLSPGAALDVGSGEGADAIWLARRGWQVVGVDWSQVALDRAAAHAADAGADVARRIVWRQEDLSEWTPRAARYDLVSAQYMHLPAGPRAVLFRRLADAVAAGGTLLLVGHHPSDLETTVRRPRAPEVYFTGDEIAASLDPQGWTIVSNLVAKRTAEDPDGNQVTVADTVFRAQRLRTD